MFKCLLSAILSALPLVSGVPAQSQSIAVPARESKGFHALNEASLRSDLSYIASDRLAGRMSLTSGDDLAIQWIADEFGKAGLRPIGKDASGKSGYLQSFQLVEYLPDRSATSMELLRKDSFGSMTTSKWTAPKAFGAFKHSIDLTAPVVFAGYGITAPELGYDDYKGIDVRGKIVFVFDHEPQEDDPKSIFNGTGNTRYATSRVKLLNAQAHGAVALILVAEPNRKHITNAERYARIGGSTRTTPMPSQAIAEDELKIPAVLIVDEVADQLFATSGTTGKALQTAIDTDLKPQSRALPGTTVTLHLRNSSEHTGTTSNVVGLLEGSDPSLKAETILAPKIRARSTRMENPHQPDRVACKSGTAQMTTVQEQSASSTSHEPLLRMASGQSDQFCSQSLPRRSGVCWVHIGWQPIHCVLWQPHVRRSTLT
jgi:hypothetical protein